jgi:hypothetical protein
MSKKAPQSALTAPPIFINVSRARLTISPPITEKASP